MFRLTFFHLFAVLVLSACVPAGGSWDRSGGSSPTADTLVETPAAPTTNAAVPGAALGAQTPAMQAALNEPVRVAVLVPQSGQGAQMGEALLQAAQLAVFDLNEPNFQLVPKDTKGTPAGTKAAVDEAAREGARLILGPLFAQEVEAAKAQARNYGLTVVGFSTDWRLAGDNTFLMGVLPFGQAERIADYAARQGLTRIAAITTKDAYGDAVLNAFTQTAQRYGITVSKTVRIAADGSDISNAVTQLEAGAYDAFFMPVGGKPARLLAAALKDKGMASSQVRYLGTGLWDDPEVLSDANMSGAVYAAPSPQTRAGFERNYQRIYGSMPPRLASIGYDSAALAIVLARNATAAGQRVTYDRNGFINPNGFSGVDGIFRFGPNGLAERGMAILQVSGGNARVVEPAPSTFMK